MKKTNYWLKISNKCALFPKCRGTYIIWLAQGTCLWHRNVKIPVLAASVVQDLPSVWSKPSTFEGPSALFYQTCDLPAPWLRGADDTLGRHRATWKYWMSSDRRDLWGWSGGGSAPAQIQQWEEDERDPKFTVAGHLTEKLLSTSSQNWDWKQTLACCWQGESRKVCLAVVGLLLS